MPDRAHAAIVALVVALGLAAALSVLMLASQTPSRGEGPASEDGPRTSVELSLSDDRIRVRHQAGPPIELRELRLERAGDELEACRSDGACTPSTTIKVGGSAIADCRPGGEHETRVWVRGQLLEDRAIACPGGAGS